MNRGTGRAEVSGGAGSGCAKTTAEEEGVFSLAAPRRGSSALRAAVARGVRPARTTRRARYPRVRV